MRRPNLGGVREVVGRLRDSLSTRWLRFVKVAVSWLDAKSSVVGLEILARLPSGWPAELALCRRYRATDPERALDYSQRLIKRNATVYQGHVQQVKILESLGRLNEARRAQAVGAMVMSRSNTAQAARTWFPDSEVRDWSDAMERLQVDASQAPRIANDIIRTVGPENALIPLKRFVDTFGGDALEAAKSHRRLPVETTIALARRLREAGEVRVPVRLVEAAPTTDVTARLRGSWSQDVEALEGQLELPARGERPVDPKPLTAMYLLHNSLPYRSAGYAIRSHGLLSGLSQLGWNMVAVTRPGFPPVSSVFDQDPDAPAQETVDTVTYRHLLGPVDVFPRADFRAFADHYVHALTPLIDEFRPGVIHAASNWWNGIAAVQAAREIGVPSVYEIRGLWEITRASRVSHWSSTERYQADSGYETLAANLADRVITITSGLRDEMVRRGVPAEKIHVVPNSVDPTKFKPDVRDTKLAEELGIGPDEVVVGFAGTFTFYEGLDDLVRAAAMIRAATEAPFRLLFVGDGPVRPDLERMAADLGISDLCLFVGRVSYDQVARYLSLCSITPFPRKPTSVTELVSPLKPLESMASGIAVIASDVGALAEMVPRDGGRLFRKGDVEDLAEKLAELIDDEGLRLRLAENGRAWVLENRTWEKAAEAVVAIYRNLGVKGSG
jgi:glycosyltransferase involved in cell wall biosynthesis